MLAIKTQTAKVQNLSTFVFDEIDAGISGQTAKIIAEKFAKISLNTQVVAITHLPQISAMSDTGFLIKKDIIGDKTLTSIEKLDEISKNYEIIRLVGGDLTSESAKILASELIKNSNEYKKSLKKS